MPTDHHGHVHLCNGGVSVVFALESNRLPAVVYWGGELPAATAGEVVATAAPAVLNSSFDQPRSVSIAPTTFQGWSGTPALVCHRGGVPASRVVLVAVESDRTSAVFTLRDHALGLGIRLEYRIDPAGVLTALARITNLAPAGEPVDVGAVRILLPVPARAAELLDFTGRWSGERRPQRSPLTDGTRLRASRRGRPGHDAAFVTVIGTRHFGFRDGEIWAVHVAWSGNSEQLVERLPEGAGSLTALIGGAELLEPGELRLAPGEEYTGPPVLFAWSDGGLDGISRRFHQHARARPNHPSSPRPLVLNTWEAVYFDHDFGRLTDLAKRAAAIGVERFVLDDGWFRGRRSDAAGLGDWTVDTEVWPRGLAELADLVHGLGMQFGLWVEPEMVNLDSDLARDHPEWILGLDDAMPLSWRHQFVLDIAQPDAWSYLYRSIDEIVSRYQVDFLKWDHNRDVHGAVDRASGALRGRAQTLAASELMDALTRTHPGLEIEACASGGGRADLGILAHAHRVWTSDTNDPIERQWIQRWTGLLLPPEVVGAHVGPAQAHTTHRESSLSLRLATALFAHAGIEWDLTACSDGERATLTAWAALYRQLRPLLHGGVTVHADDLDDGAVLEGVVSEDGRHALFAWMRIGTSATAHTPRVRFPGLRCDVDYALRTRTEIGPASRHQVADPAWFPAPGMSAAVSGGLLTGAGVPLPQLNPGQVLLLELLAGAEPPA
ncbi:alpha-galactosidase [Dactylosporangium sp. NPDC000244]|uniref:alpha-galactosidase n=1 Tax=Dactylosporangium sp. NPDC000244 TaxID=3154365 RepID=UPI0033264D73